VHRGAGRLAAYCCSSWPAHDLREVPEETGFIRRPAGGCQVSRSRIATVVLAPHPGDGSQPPQPGTKTRLASARQAGLLVCGDRDDAAHVDPHELRPLLPPLTTKSRLARPIAVTTSHGEGSTPSPHPGSQDATVTLRRDTAAEEKEHRQFPSEGKLPALSPCLLVSPSTLAKHEQTCYTSPVGCRREVSWGFAKRRPAGANITTAGRNTEA